SALAGFKLEADASEKGIDRSASLTLPVERGLIKRAVAGESAIGLLFAKKHSKFLNDIGRKTIDFDRLTTFGPITAQRWESVHLPCPWPVTAELWQRTDKSRLMELSMRCPASHGAFAIAGFGALLHEVGVERNKDEKSKTRWALYKPS